MTDKQRDMLNDIAMADMCVVISSREQTYNDNIRRLRKENAELKNIIRHLYKGLDELYLSGLTEKQIALVEQLQDKANLFVEEE